jgi:hypothetical protein
MRSAKLGKGSMAAFARAQNGAAGETPAVDHAV